jgi:hypothetical protein
MRKEAVSYRKALSRYMPGAIEVNYDEPLESRYPSRDLNPGPPEFEAVFLTTDHDVRCLKLVNTTWPVKAF